MVNTKVLAGLALLGMSSASAQEEEPLKYDYYRLALNFKVAAKSTADEDTGVLTSVATGYDEEVFESCAPGAVRPDKDEDAADYDLGMFAYLAPEAVDMLDQNITLAERPCVQHKLKDSTISLKYNCGFDKEAGIYKDAQVAIFGDANCEVPLIELPEVATRTDYCAAPVFVMDDLTDVPANSTNVFVSAECRQVEAMAPIAASTLNDANVTVEMHFRDNSSVTLPFDDLTESTCETCSFITEDMSYIHTSLSAFAISDYVAFSYPAGIIGGVCRPVKVVEWSIENGIEVNKTETTSYVRVACDGADAVVSGVNSQTLFSDATCSTPVENDGACFDGVTSYNAVGDRWCAVVGNAVVETSAASLAHGSSFFGRRDGECGTSSESPFVQSKVICQPRNIKGTYVAPDHLGCKSPLSVEMPVVFAGVLFTGTFSALVMIGVYLRAKKIGVREYKATMEDEDVLATSSQ